MKKLLLIVWCVVCTHLSISNPILYPMLSEIYFEGDNWIMELFSLCLGIDNLDSCRITTCSDTSIFMSGIYFNEEHWVVVTQNDMQSPLTVNKYGDFLMFEVCENGQWYFLTFGMAFGDIEWSSVNYPFEGQSIVNNAIYWGDPITLTNFWPVKDNNPTLGSSIFHTTTWATFSGAVYDLEMLPVEGAQIKYCPSSMLGISLFPIYTDHTGFFYATDMPARNYNVSILYNDVSFLDTLITLEPDSTTYCEFIIDTSSVDIPEKSVKQNISFQNYPNPCRESTTFVVQLPEDNHYSKARLMVYDLNGRVVYSYEFNENISVQSKLFHNWNLLDNSLNSGEYIGILEVDGKVLADNKILVIK